MRAIALLLASAAGAAAACPKDPAVVDTPSGCVRGEKVDRVWRFRGIPYAAPPTGALRWRPPSPPAHWKGVREALSFGKSCPQSERLITGEALETDEDCLSVNVWTQGAAGKRPVMVWLHGGGLATGGSAQGLYDGGRLADAGVVVVTVNYRLGPLGWLAHPALSVEDPLHHASGNWGLHDQIAALDWVRRAAPAFGGDPERVTVFGESAGSMSICALLASPLAHGRLQRAILESGGCASAGKRARPLRAPAGEESAEAQGLRLQQALGCAGPDALACMRGKGAGEVISAMPTVVGLSGRGERWAFAVDGWSLPRAPGDALARGELAAVPAMVGSNRDEATIFTGKMQLLVDGPMRYQLATRALLGAHADQALALYPAARFSSPSAAFDALVTELAFTCPARQQARGLAKRAKVFRYQFARATDAMAARPIGACHGCELRFVFGTLREGAAADDRALSQAMIGYWTRFAATGDPNPEAPVAGTVAWPSYDPARDTYLRLDVPSAAAAGLQTEACDLFETIAPRDN